MCIQIEINNSLKLAYIYKYVRKKGDPKGVRLSYLSYATNAATFDSFLLPQDFNEMKLVAVVTNPFHHTNSTAITDWALRRPNSQLELFQRYSTNYWTILAEIATTSSTTTSASSVGAESATASEEEVLPSCHIVAPLVSKHIDFLENLFENQGFVDRDPDYIRQALSSASVSLLLGSAPVGPSTVERLGKYCGGKLPIVRFGSTETCLQVLGTPPSLSLTWRLSAFEEGWNHKTYQREDEPCIGYYIGRDHHPHNEVKVVLSIERGHEHYLKEVCICIH